MSEYSSPLRRTSGSARDALVLATTSMPRNGPNRGLRLEGRRLAGSELGVLPFFPLLSFFCSPISLPKHLAGSAVLPEQPPWMEADSPGSRAPNGVTPKRSRRNGLSSGPPLFGPPG